MSQLVVGRKREQDSPLFNYRRLLDSPKLCIRPEIIGQFPKQGILIHSVDHFEPCVRLGTRIRRRIGLDDSESRIAIWKTLFEDKPLPTIEENAVEKYAGSLDKYLPENVPIDEVTKHAKKG